MNIKEVSKAVQAIRLAGNEDGIISIRGNEVHLNNETFESVIAEYRMKPIIANRDSEDHPYEVSFISENAIYYSIYTSERMEEKIGGIPNSRKLNGSR
ncbi:hypothetical protein [Bacillus toyonensis]|uniref:Uncharacterized protein n=1 Tax=Bacillus toyonensis TaxID=155322 RepID=A0A2C4Q9W2_9BACI|nr:hypothetical protein [Bacillus toyonensis]PGA92159.1 hypothetical protein COL93_26525 [Bacillus toyonensis]PHD61242.1 hypothetical protein COF40_26565 [Bacillus toyonensis]